MADLTHQTQPASAIGNEIQTLSSCDAKLIGKLAVSIAPELDIPVDRSGGSDIERQSASPLSDNQWRKAVSLATVVVRTGVLFGGTVSVWNYVRQIGGPTSGKRFATEASASALVGLSFPEIDRFAGMLEKNLIGIPEFTGETSLIRETGKAFLTSLAGGAGIAGGVQLAGFFNDLANKGEKPFEWLILGYIIAFAAVGAVNLVGEAALGKKIELRRSDEPLSVGFRAAAKNFLREYLALNTLLKERLPNSLPYLVYNYYASPLAEVSENADVPFVGLWGGLVIFLASYKIAAYLSAQLPDLHWGDITGDVGGNRNQEK